ncbi:hypothetical protein EC988_010365, partial [Linderina pennispora]
LTPTRATSTGHWSSPSPATMLRRRPRPPTTRTLAVPRRRPSAPTPAKASARSSAPPTTWRPSCCWVLATDWRLTGGHWVSVCLSSSAATRPSPTSRPRPSSATSSTMPLTGPTTMDTWVRTPSRLSAPCSTPTPPAAHTGRTSARPPSTATGILLISAALSRPLCPCPMMT